MLQESIRFLYPYIHQSESKNKTNSTYHWTDVVQDPGSFVSCSCYLNRSPKYRGNHPPGVKDLESFLPDHNFSKELSPNRHDCLTFPFMISFMVNSAYSSSTGSRSMMPSSGSCGGGKQFLIFFSFFLGEHSSGELVPEDDVLLDVLL